MKGYNNGLEGNPMFISKVVKGSFQSSCQGHSTLSSQRVFEGARLTQLVQLVTAGRLFLGHKGQVDP